MPCICSSLPFTQGRRDTLNNRISKWTPPPPPRCYVAARCRRRRHIPKLSPVVCCCIVAKTIKVDWCKWSNGRRRGVAAAVDLLLTKCIYGDRPSSPSSWKKTVATTLLLYVEVMAHKRLFALLQHSYNDCSCRLKKHGRSEKTGLLSVTAIE